MGKRSAPPKKGKITRFIIGREFDTPEKVLKALKDIFKSLQEEQKAEEKKKRKTRNNRERRI